jgi:tRNA 2-selenouridine synthase SelU
MINVEITKRRITNNGKEYQEIGTNLKKINPNKVLKILR